MTGFPLHLHDMAGLCGRILRIKSSDREAQSAEPWGEVALSAQAKRRRILEEARSAVLDRIRHTR